MTKAIFGPTFEEMLHPSAIDPAIRQRAVNALTESPLDPVRKTRSGGSGISD
jgi:cysteine synthase A